MVSFAAHGEPISEGDRQAAASSMASTASLGQPWQTRMRRSILNRLVEPLGFVEYSRSVRPSSPNNAIFPPKRYSSRRRVGNS